MGLSGSSSRFSTGGGSWYIFIEEYSRRWIFQGTGTRGRTGGWSIGDDGLDGSLGSSGGSSDSGDGFNGNGRLAMSGGLVRVTRRGPMRMRKIGVDHNTSLRRETILCACMISLPSR